MELTAEKRRNPADDIWSTIASAVITGDDGEQFSLAANELEFFFFVLAFAGSDTTKNALAIGLQAFVANPDQIERYRDDESLRSSAVEEVLRWASPVAYWTRSTKVDIEMDGQHIPKGERVVAMLRSANRDEEVFDSPFTFDIGRHPNPHVAFGGGGAHHCLGAMLARAEIRAVLDEMLLRCDGITLGTAQVTYPNLTTNMSIYDEMPVTLRRAVGGSVDQPQRGLGALVDRGRYVDLQMLRHVGVGDMHHVGFPDHEDVRRQRFAEPVGLTQRLVDDHSHRFSFRSISQTLGPGPDHTGGRQARELLIGEPAQVAQYLGIVLAERRRRPHQPPALTVQRGERRTRVAARTGTRMVERFQKSAIVELEFSVTSDGETTGATGMPAPARSFTRIADPAGEPVVQPPVDLVGVRVPPGKGVVAAVVGP